jgi:hypothetical protein
VAEGTLVAYNAGQELVAEALETHECFETQHRELREWTYDESDRILFWEPG